LCLCNFQVWILCALDFLKNLSFIFRELKINKYGSYKADSP